MAQRKEKSFKRTGFQNSKTNEVTAVPAWAYLIPGDATEAGLV